MADDAAAAPAASTPLPDTVAAPPAPSTDTQGPTPSNAWTAAAADATPKPGQPAPDSQQMPTTETPGEGNVADQPAPVLTPVPVPITPLKRPGILGMVDSIRDTLAGKTTPELGKDPDGNTYVKQTTLSHGEQWVRIGLTALTGEAKGWAAGKGGNPGAAAAAGVDEGQKIAQQRQDQQKDMSAQAQAQNLANANNQMLRMKVAEQSMAATRLQTEATQHDIEFAQGQEDRYVKAGGTVLGTMAKPTDLRNILKVNPDVMSDMIEKHQIEMVPHVNADGKRDGFTVIKMPSGYRQTMLPAGATFHTFDQTSGQYVPHQSADPMTQGEQDDYEHKAASDALQFQNSKAELAQKAAATEKDKADTEKATQESKLVPSEILKNRAEASKAIADANKAKEVDANDPSVSTLGEALARGTLTEDMITGMKQQTRAAVQTYLAQHHPNLDQKSVFATGAERQRGDLANNAIHNLDMIGPLLQRRPDLIGKADGLITQGKEAVGTDDADLATVMTALDNYGLAATGGHGVKAVAARTDAKKSLLNNFKNGPQAVAASIATAKSSLQNLAAVGQPKGVNGQPYVYNAQQQQQPQSADLTKPPAIPAGTAPPAAGVKRIWAPGSPTWKDVPEAQVPKNVSGLVIQ